MTGDVSTSLDDWTAHNESEGAVSYDEREALARQDREAALRVARSEPR
jgi:hypothetical protein